ncbi:MAG: adenosylcobinamide amidohydrolase [Nitrospirae bacterium]|nr:adenosylcobinamide amidohydrolase [Nitrospirota bacterium]
MVKVDQKQWREFNPEVIYYCGKDSRIIDFIKKSEGWKDVIAVQKGRIYSFPCELTCRASVNAGYFIKWLFSSIYEEELFSSTKLLYTEGIYSRRKIELPLTYVESAEIVYSKLKDYTSKALLIRFKTPMNIVSTLEGQRTGIMTVGNHYLPPNLWSWAHRIGLEGSRDYVYKILRLNRADSSLLFTGADMDNLAIVKKSFKAMSVYALVTAGVRSNAVRTSVDVGRFYEPGTINIILMTNMKLTPRAMTRAIITATEAKTAALQDLDIRSSQTPIESQATGTGTDNIIVVQGTGYQIDNSGGHTKMGELIGNAVYDAVIQAIKKQNGIEKDRDVFQRLLERGISLYDVVFSARLPEDVNKKELLAKLEALLLKPEYAGFMLTALELSNSKNNYLKESFKRWAENIVSEIKGKQAQVIPIVEKSKWPVPIKIAFDALIGGIIEN